MPYPNLPASLLTPVQTRPGTRTYSGHDCPLKHGGRRYCANGLCIECARIHRRDQQTLSREMRAALPHKQPAYRREMLNAKLDEAQQLLQAAGRALMEAKAACPRGMWFAGLRARGLDKRTASIVRRLGEASIQASLAAAKFLK